MSEVIYGAVVVEGKTEEIFIKVLIAPYLASKGIYLVPTIISKSGQKGGDVKFERAKKDIKNFLYQSHNAFVTTLIDYYGVKEWPGIESAKTVAEPKEIANIINSATKEVLSRELSKINIEEKFIPYIAVYEFESLLFSDPEILKRNLVEKDDLINAVIKSFGEPERINNSPETAPSKLLDQWYKTGEFPKTTLGIKIAKEIGIAKMREKCPLFNKWISQMESFIDKVS